MPPSARCRPFARAHGRLNWYNLRSSRAFGGCGHRAIDFNNQVASIHARLGTAVEQFARILRPAVDEGRAPSADQFADAAERLRGEVAAAAERSGQLRVPDLPQAGE